MRPMASANWSTTASSSDTALGKRLPASIARRLISTECTGVRRALISMRSLMHETQAHDGVGGLRELLLQVGHHADDLMAEHVQAQMLVRPEQGLARQLRQPRVMGDPGAAAGIGERQMHPGPADMVGERPLDRLVGDELGGAVRLEMINPDDAGFRRGVRGIAAGGARLKVMASSCLAGNRPASGSAAHDRMMTGRTGAAQRESGALQPGTFT